MWFVGLLSWMYLLRRGSMSFYEADTGAGVSLVLIRRFALCRSLHGRGLQLNSFQ